MSPVKPDQDYSQRTTPNYLHGLFLTLLGVPDLWIVVDIPSCLPEVIEESALSQHAWTEPLVRPGGRSRIFRSDLSASGQDTERHEALIARLQRAIERDGAPALLLVAESVPARVLGRDIDGIAELCESRLGIRARPVVTTTLNRDYLDAFEACLETMARAIEPSVGAGASESPRVALVGNLFHRNAADQRADVAELRRMIQALGAEPGAIWTSGRALSELEREARHGVCVSLPYGRRAAEVLATRDGADRVDLPLPIGIEGSRRWVEALAERIGDTAQAVAFCEEEIGALVPELAGLVEEQLAGRRVLLIADPPLAKGLTAFLAELGMEVVATLLRRRRPLEAEAGSESATYRTTDPSEHSIREALAHEERLGGRVDLILASSWEGSHGVELGLPVLELGFPSVNDRPLRPRPTLGFRGAASLVERMARVLAEARVRQRAAARRARSGGSAAGPGGQAKNTRGERDS